MFCSTGKRKSSIAKVVVLKGGDGSILVNNVNYKSYFGRQSLAHRVITPFLALNLDISSFTIKISALGGGLMGQSESARHGISKILSKICDESGKKILRNLGYLTRDSRAVESKKSGLKKARKRSQFSKR